MFGLTTNKYKSTPLIEACRLGNVEMVKLLIANGVDLDMCGCDDEILPLEMCCYNGNLEIVKLLITNGAEYRTRDSDSRGPLMVATIGNHPEVVQYLFDSGCK